MLFHPVSRQEVHTCLDHFLMGQRHERDLYQVALMEVPTKLPAEVWLWPLSLPRPWSFPRLSR